MLQVKECMEKAHKGEAYVTPLENTEFFRLARPNLASEEVQKASPGSRKELRNVRQLSEGLREEDSEAWDSSTQTVAIIGTTPHSFHLEKMRLWEQGGDFSPHIKGNTLKYLSLRDLV